MVSLAIAAVSALGAVLFSRRIVRPLRELTEAAKKIAAGDLSVNIKHYTNDEVGILAKSFQQTVQHLQTYINYINGLAYKDPLTGVKSKAAYQEAVKSIDNRLSNDPKKELILIVFDINYLKHINDTFGHDVGDILIKDSCRLICQTFKQSPVYRIGGDEFVVILGGQDLVDYQALLIKLYTDIDNYNSEASHKQHEISIASGVGIFDPAIDSSFSNVFKRADEAMYHNKAMIKAMSDIHKP